MSQETYAKYQQLKTGLTDPPKSIMLVLAV